MESADAIVVGLGAIGSATLLRLARLGLRAIGIDRFHPPHDLGSSHGQSRITRLAVGEGPDYAPLVRRSHELWRELEAETGQELFLQTGGLILGPEHGAARHHGQADFVRRSITVAQRFGIAHDVLAAGDIAARFPQFGVRGDEIGYYEPSAGMLFPERCIQVQLDLARAAGARVVTGTQVVQLQRSGAATRVVTTDGSFEAARVVLAAGPWTAPLAGARLGPMLRVYRQTLHWFAAPADGRYQPGRFPVFIWMHGDRPEDYFYGFPALPGGDGVKVATETYQDAIAADQVDRTVSANETDAVYQEHVHGRLADIGPRSTRAAVCLYTVTPDSGFLVDDHPDLPNVVIASTCSGHGFKHSAALGERLAALVAGDADRPEPPLTRIFAASRYEQCDL